jgi:hypothetical protein
MENVFVVVYDRGNGFYRLRAEQRSGPPADVYSATPLQVGQRVRLDVVVLEQPE